jgi:hypothetical protein
MEEITLETQARRNKITKPLYSVRASPPKLLENIPRRKQSNKGGRLDNLASSPEVCATLPFSGQVAHPAVPCRAQYHAEYPIKTNKKNQVIDPECLSKKNTSATGIYMSP